ncbi:MAG: hypothetical protein ACPGVN_05450 [Alphaproteobacteria bacterium]
MPIKDLVAEYLTDKHEPFSPNFVLEILSILAKPSAVVSSENKSGPYPGAYEQASDEFGELKKAIKLIRTVKCLALIGSFQIFDAVGRTKIDLNWF